MQVVISMEPNLKRSIILDHYQNPRHKSLTDDPSYITENMNNTSCIDEVNVQLKVGKRVRCVRHQLPLWLKL